ncbi:MAG: PKD domain-containing protein [Bacteroidia bacterium]
MVKRLLSVCTLLLVLALFLLTKTSSAQAVMSGTNAFIKGTYSEIGISGIGGFEGAPLPAPVGYHARGGGNPYFGFVSNPQMNAWLTYDGDFFVPGSPENGWGIELPSGINYGNNCSFLQQINGAITSVSNVFTCYSATWEGDLTTGTNLHFKINYLLKQSDLYYTTTVSVTNNTAATIPTLYYYRNFDPDNNEPISFDFTTTNTIVAQPFSGLCNTAHVKATSVNPASQPMSYVGLAATGVNWRADYGGFSNRDGSDLWNGIGFTQTVGSSTFADIAISLAYKINNLAPGATETFKFVVILDDLAATNAVANTTYLSYPGSATAPPASCTLAADTVKICQGVPAAVTVTGPNVPQYNWTWSPAAGLSATTGVTVNVSPATSTSYTVTGTPINACFPPVSFPFYVLVRPSPIVNPVPNQTYCAGAIAPVTAFTSTPVGATYTWTNSNTAIGLGAGGAGSVPSFTTVNPGSTPITSTVTVTPTIAGNPCPGLPLTYTITVNPNPVVNPVANITVCSGATIPASAFASTPAGATFTWTNSNTAIGLAAGGAGNVPSFVGTNITAAPITGTITVTPSITPCTGPPLTYTITINPNPTSTYTQSANQCLTGNSFNFTSTGSSGAGYSQTWTFSGGTPSTSTLVSPTGITWAAPGTYTVTHTVTATGGCVSTTTSTVTIFASPTGLTTTVVNSTCGLSNGVINIGVAAGGTGPYTYSVNGSPFTGTLSYTGFATGTYSVVVKDANGCTFSTTAFVGNSPGPTALAVSTVNSTCGLSNGIINIGATTGGTAPYTFSVNGGPFTGTTSYTGFAVGTYTVIVKDVNGCTFSTTATIVNTSGPVALATSTVNSTCGNANGTINIGVVTGGTAAYTYSVNASAFTSTTTYGGLAAGTYTVVVKDANGCTFSTTATIANSPGPTALATTHVNSTCGASNGSITMGAVTGGAPAYTYSVNGGPFSATTTVTGFAAGTYTVVVKDANGCTFSTTVTITNNPGPTALAVSSTNSSCGAANGTATLGAVTGGTAPYTYSFAASAFTSTTTYTGLTAGVYTVVVKDANGCTFSTSVTIANTAGPSAVAISTVNSTCGASNGTLTIGAVTGGTAAYTYSVNASAFTPTTSYTGLAAGTYTVVVKDANGCTFSTTATVVNSPGPTAVALTTVNSTCGNNNGVINIGAVTGGTPAFTYSVNGNPFAATTSYTGYGAGTYTVIVKDANGCTFSTTVTVVNTPGPTALAVTTTNSTCAGSNGIVNIGAVTGGTATYVYSFNGSAFTPTTNYTGIAPGTYTVVVKDANGCTFSVLASVGLTTGPVGLAATTVNSTCGNANGVVNIGAVTGGVAPYTYSFNGGGFSATTSYPGVAAGTYNVVVKDANGCTYTITVTVNNTPGPTALGVTSTNTACGASTGTITVGATTGGTAPYTYSVNGSPFTATTAYSGFAANTYTVIVKDANGCTFSTTVIVANSSGPTALVVNTTNSSCGASNGTLTIGATTGGLAPYSYSVNGGSFSTTTSYTSLAAGTYTVIVKDANGCQFTTTATVANVAGPTAMVVNSTNATCGNSNGTITLGAVSGGTTPYTYSVNGSPFTATTAYTGFGPGTFTCIVKDANGCTYSTSVIITNIPGPTAVATTLTNTTCSASNGSVIIGAVTGGTSAYTYSFNGSPFTATTSYTGLAAGTYPIIVKDANGCTFSTSVVLTNSPGPTALAVTSTNPTCGNSNGTITVGAVTGGTPTYLYSFNGGGFSSTVSYTSLTPGTYTVVVQDANGCTFSTTRTITNVAGPTALATATTNASCGSSTGSVTIGATTGGTGPYTYSFNGSAFTTTTSYTSLPANVYTVVVQDANGCSFTTTATISNASGPTALATTFTNATCGNNNGTVTIGATTGGVLPLSYSFNGGAFSTTTNYTGLAPGTYTIIVKDAGGCTFTTTVTISNIGGPTSLLLTTTNTTCGGANGSITMGAVTGGTSPYTYSVNASAFTGTTTYPGLVAGTYAVVVKDANGCTYSTTATLTNTSGPTALATTVTNATCGTNNGVVTLGAVTGGTPAYTYSFAGSPFTSTISYTGLAAGSYTIIVKDGNGCQFTTTANVVAVPGPTALVTTTNPSSCGLNNGAVNIGAVTGGTPPYTYSFNGGGFTATTSYTSVAAGSYSVIVKDANGCTFTVTPTVTNVAGPTAIATTHVNTTCGGANGSITIGAITGGTGPYQYSVNGSALSATTTYPGLVANTYNVTVQDANGCSFTTTVTVTDLSGLLASITAQTNVSCNGGANGSVTVTASGSTGPYSYSINGGPFGASGTFSGLASGAYTVTAKDGNGCTIAVPVTIAQPPVLVGTLTAQTNVLCMGATNGTATVTASGGVNPYTYSVDAGSFGGSSTFGGLGAGVHTITIKDANGCTVTVTVTIASPPALTLATSSTNATCTASNGSASVVASGGTPAYTYAWTPGAGSASATYNSIPAGNYTVLVTDFNGCTASSIVNVGVTPGGTASISSSTNVSCNGAADGTATVSMSGGSTPPFTYLWSPGGQTTVTATGLTPASYTVQVTDGHGCIASASVIITQPTPLAQTFTTTNISCFGGNNGIITINPSGGTGPYTYFWTPGSYTTQTINTLTVGTYTCTFTDAHGCTHTASAGVTQPTGMTLSSTQVNATCNLANGSATISVSGGSGPYTYLWSDPGAQTTTTATGLPANTYVCTVTDANGCSQNLSVTILNNAGPVATVFSSNNVSCNGNNDGSATVTVSGGVIPFTFNWSDGQTLPSATNLVAGTYTLTATDANGCIASTSVTITEPTPLSLAVTGVNPSCNGACNGTLTATPAGGTTPYSYSWSPGGATTPNLTGMCAGTYTLLVTDAHGCTIFNSYTLINPPAFSVTTSGTNISCSGMCNGTATATPVTGTGPFTYAWSDISAQTTQTATSLCSGTYTVTATDAGGCTTTATQVITSPPSMTLTVPTIGPNTCFNACDGFATAAVAGGSAPYTFNWMPGGIAGASVNNLCAGTYTVTVTDANGCSTFTTVVITQPNALVATISSTNVTCYAACNGTATAVYSGGTGPYTFQWAPGFQTTPTITSICAGSQTLTVTDANGCITNTMATITEPTVLAVTTSTTNSNCGVANGSACAAITGGVPPFSYLWNDPSAQTSNCATSISAGVYNISVTDAHGCVATAVANVNDNSAPVVTIPVSSNVTCAGAANGSAQAAITGGIIPYNIMWTPGAMNTAFVSGLSGGFYSVTVTDSVGCIGTASIAINEPGPLVSGIVSSSNVSCYLSCNGAATVSAGGGTLPYTYLWNDGAAQTTAAASALCAQGYTVTVTDANGCTSTSSTTITSPTQLTVSLVSSTNVTCNGGNNGAITISAAGGTPGYTYSWSPSVGSGPTVTNLTAGTYTVVVTDAHACNATLVITINQPSAITTATITNPSTCGQSNGFVSVSPSGGTPGYTYLWNTTPAQTTAIASGLFAGTYSVIVTDNAGCTSTTPVVLGDVAGPTISAINYVPPSCYGTPLGSATVIPSGGTPLYTYVWSDTASQTTQMASALVTGLYSVTVTDNNGCSVTGSVFIPQPPPMQIIVSPLDTICIGQAAMIYGAGYGGTPGYTYTWLPSTITGPGPNTVTPTVTSTYDVYATDANGCNSPTQTITVAVNPPIVVTATDVSVCAGSSVGISAIAAGGNGGPYSFVWTPSTGLSNDSISNPTATPLVTTNYVVAVDDGCTVPSYNAFDTATVTVNPLAVSNMFVTDTAGCEDFTVTFNGTSDIGTSYSWNFGDGSPAQTGEPVVHTYPNPGSYNVTLTVTTGLGCQSSITNSNYIDVYPGPTAGFSTSPSEITQTAPEVTIGDLSSGATQWYYDFVYPGAVFTDTLQNPVYSYPDTGTYVIQQVVTNSYGCTDTAFNSVYVIPEFAFYAPNAFTPNNHDGLNDLFMPKGVGIDPNNFEMMIFDRWGNMIFRTDDVNKGWDGRANHGDNLAQIDTYVWKVNTKDSRGNEKQYIGHVTIVK